MACTTAVLTAGCARSHAPADLTIEHEVSPQPVRAGRVTITFKLADAGKLMTGARVGLEADMSHPGMSPVFGQADEIEPGRYRGRLELGMAGDWVILLHIALPDGRKLERQIDVRGVQPN